MNRSVRSVAILAVVSGAFWLIHWLDGYPTWRLFFAWPVGGTWSNMIASFEWIAVASGTIWLFRDHIGRHLARWWHKHHGEHAAAEMKAEFGKMLAEHHKAIHERLDAQTTSIARLHERIRVQEEAGHEGH